MKFLTDQLGDRHSNAGQFCGLYRPPRDSPRSCLTLSCPSRCSVPTCNFSHAAGIVASYVRQCKAWVSNPQAVCSSPGCVMRHEATFINYVHTINILRYSVRLCIPRIIFFHVRHANWSTITGWVLCHEKGRPSLKGSVNLTL